MPKSIKDGSLDDRLQAIDQLREIKPREAIPELLKIAGAKFFPITNVVSLPSWYWASLAMQPLCRIYCA